MNKWLAIRDEYFSWLRVFPLLTRIGQPDSAPEVIGPSDAPVYLEVGFWSERTHEAEDRARRLLIDAEIDSIFSEIAAVIDENLRRFDPLVAYYGRFFPDGDPGRIEDERQAAHSVKRDLAWAAIERGSVSQRFSVPCSRGTIEGVGRVGGLASTLTGICEFFDRLSGL